MQRQHDIDTSPIAAWPSRSFPMVAHPRKLATLKFLAFLLALIAARPSRSSAAAASLWLLILASFRAPKFQFCFSKLLLAPPPPLQPGLPTASVAAASLRLLIVASFPCCPKCSVFFKVFGSFLLLPLPHCSPGFRQRLLLPLTYGCSPSQAFRDPESILNFFLCSKAGPQSPCSNATEPCISLLLKVQPLGASPLT